MKFKIRKPGEKFNYKILIILGIFIILISLFFILPRYLKTEDKIYRSENLSFSYPGNWQEISLENSQEVDPEFKIGFGDPKGETKFLLRIKDGVPEIQSFEKIEQELDKAMGENLDSFKKISSAEIKINDRESLDYNYTYKLEEEEVRQKIILIFGEEKIYYLIFHAPKEKFEIYKENFDLIISSFRI